MKVTVRYSAKMQEGQGKPIDLAPLDSVSSEPMRIAIPISSQERGHYEASAPRGGESIDDIAAEIAQRLANMDSAPRPSLADEIASYFAPEETEWAMTKKPTAMPMLKVNSGMMVNRSESETISGARIRKVEFA